MLALIKRDLISLSRDKGALFFIVLFPSLLVFLLGNLLQNMDNSDSVIEPIRMAYTVETEDPLALAAVDALASALKDNATVEFAETDDAENAQSRVNAGELAAAVRFTDGFGTVVYEGFDTIRNRAIDSIFRGFSRQAASAAVLGATEPEKLGEMATAATAAAESLVAQKHFGYRRSMLDYYAVAMCVMIVFMGSGIAGSTTLYDGKRDGTLRRTLASPKNRASMYVQTVSSGVVQCVLQVLCVMLASTLLFGARYANTFADNLLLFALLVLAGLAANAVGMLLGLLVNVNPMVILMPILWVLMFFSGTFSKEIFVDGISNYSPVWMLQNAAFDLTVFGRGEKCLWAMLACGAVLALATLVGALLFRRKGLVAK